MINKLYEKDSEMNDFGISKEVESVVFKLRSMEKFLDGEEKRKLFKLENEILDCIYLRQSIAYQKGYLVGSRN